MDIIAKYKGVRTHPSHASINYKQMFSSQYKREEKDRGDLIRVINVYQDNEEGNWLLLVRYIFQTKNFYLVKRIHPMSEFWLWRKGTRNCFWRESSMIMYLSSAVLLLEMPVTYDNKQLREHKSRLQRCLVAWLDTRLECGFTEYQNLSSLPYVFEALLNLADFSSNNEFREKSQLLIMNLITIFRENFPTHPGTRIVQSTLQPKFLNRGIYHSVIDFISLVQGRSFIHFNSRFVCNALTSKFFTFCILQQLIPMNPMRVRSGTIKLSNHRYEKIINSCMLDEEDKVLFLWSNGIMFDSSMAQQSIALLSKYSLWLHPHFRNLSYLKGIKSNLFHRFVKYISPKYLGNQLLPETYHYQYRPGVSITYIKGERNTITPQRLPFILSCGSQICYFLANESSSIDTEFISTRIPRVEHSSDMNQYRLTYRPHRLTPFVGKRVFIKLFDIHVVANRTITMTHGNGFINLTFSCNFTEYPNNFVMVNKFYFTVDVEIL